MPAPTSDSRQRLRILYLHQYFVPPETNGGTRSYEFARRLLAAGHDVRMITSSAMLPPSYQAARHTYETTIAGIPTVVIPVPYSNHMSFRARIGAFVQFAARAAWEAARRPADVVFATSTPLTIAIPGILASVWRRVPMVFEVRDLWPELPIAMGLLSNPLLKAAALALEWLAYHASAHVIALSPGMAAGIVRRGIPDQRITVIPNSCDLELFDVPAERGQHIRSRIPGLTDGDPLIVYAGTFGHINGVEYLADVAAAARVHAPALRFLLVGDGVASDKLHERARALGVLDVNLWIWKPLPKQEIPDLLAAATVATSLFLPIPAMQHNSANKFFDALAAGRPLAINYGGWHADLLRESGAGISLPPDDPTQAAQLLGALVANRAALDQAGRQARHLAQTRFNRDAMARAFEAVLCGAAGLQPSGLNTPDDARVLDGTEHVQTYPRS
jgi:glycosyltransferase involved in cell wall biosynthesis